MFCESNGPAKKKVTTVISGGAKGIDTLAFEAAEKAGLKSICYLPDRKRFPGRLIVKAYQRRNEHIVDACDILLAIWDGESHGTRNTIVYAQKIGRPVFLVEISRSSMRPRPKRPPFSGFSRIGGI